MNSYQSIDIFDDNDISNYKKSLIQGDQVVLWNGHSDGNLQNSISIQNYIEKNASLIRNEYLSWIYKITNSRLNDSKSLVERLQISNGYSIWWSSLIFQKCNFEKSNYIDDSIKFIALGLIMSKYKIRKIRLFSSNRKLNYVLKDWAKENKIIYKFEFLPGISKSKKYKKRLRNLYSRIPHFFQGLIWFIYYIINRFPLKDSGLKYLKNNNSRITFISYLFNNTTKNINQSSFESRYWGNLPEKLRSSKIQTNWLHIYIKDKYLPNSLTASKYLAGLNNNQDNNQFHLCLDSFLSFDVIQKSFLNWLFIICKNISINYFYKPKKLAGFNIWSLYQYDFLSSIFGKDAIKNILYSFLFTKFSRSIPRQDMAIFLFEGLDWEYAFIDSWRKANHGFATGCVHSSVRFWDLRNFNDTRFYKLNSNYFPFPDYIAVNGPLSYKILLESNLPEYKIRKVEALRFLYLNSISNKDKSNKYIDRKDNELTLLVFTDYNYNLTNRQLLLLSNACNLFRRKVRIIVKPHPYTPLKLEDYPNLRFSITEESISDILCLADIVYVSGNTTASVDAYCYGCTVISYLDDFSLNLSPLREIEDIHFVSNQNQLADRINNLDFCSSKNDSLNFFSNIFYIDENLFQWSELLGYPF